MRELPKTKTNLELKREFWENHNKYNPELAVDIDKLIEEDGSQPSTFLEARFILGNRILEVLDVVPLIGRITRLRHRS